MQVNVVCVAHFMSEIFIVNGISKCLTTGKKTSVRVIFVEKAQKAMI